MNVLVAGYDKAIAVSNGSETDITNAIMSQGSWAKLVDNVYTVVTPLTQAQLRDQMVQASAGRPNRVFVYDVTNKFWATTGMPVDVNNWLQNNWSQS